MSIYDLIEFPNKDIRETIRLNYPVFSKYKQLPMDMLKKYEGIVVPCEFEEYETVITWINEYNHLLFFMFIPLYQAIDTHQKMNDSDNSSDLFRHLRALFYYFSEIVAYYIDCAFEKSAHIFNAMFELRVNEHCGSLKQILKRIKEGADKSAIFQEVTNKLEIIYRNEYFRNLINIRNKNTHSIKVLHRNLYDVYDPKTKVTSTYVSKVIMPDEILNTIFGAMELLSDYTSFIEGIIDKYYTSIYEEFCSHKEDFV